MPIMQALIIEDSVEIAEAIACWLSLNGWRVRTCGSRDAAIHVLNEARADLILLDHRMPGMTAEIFVPLIRAMLPSPKILFMSGGMDLFEMASKLGIGNALQKPFDNGLLLSSIHRIMSAEPAGRFTLH